MAYSPPAGGDFGQPVISYLCACSAINLDFAMKHGDDVAMNRLYRIAAIVCLAATTASAQSGLTGSWSTDPAPTGWAGWSDSAKPNTFTKQPAFAYSSTQRPLNPNAYPTAAFMSFKLEGGKIVGFLGVDNVWDLPMKMELGVVEGKSIRFMTVRVLLGRDPIYWEWMADWKDENTLILRRGNINAGSGSAGRPSSSRTPPAPAPAALPPVSKSALSNLTLTLHRVK